MCYRIVVKSGLFSGKAISSKKIPWTRRFPFFFYAKKHFHSKGNSGGKHERFEKKIFSGCSCGWGGII
jgi:hypothetical protein